MGERSTFAQTPNGIRSGRFLYVLNCGADLYKFEVSTGKTIGHVDLARRTQLIPTHGDVAGSVVDGCSTTGSVYLPDESILLTLAPTSGSVDLPEGRKFRLLRFHLPELRFLGSVTVPGSHKSAPRLALSSTGVVQVFTAKDTFSLVGNKLVLATEVNEPSCVGSWPIDELGGSSLDGLMQDREIDVAGYDLSRLELNPLPNHLTYKPLETSGNVTLIEFVDAGQKEQGSEYAALDNEAKRIVALKPGFSTTEKNFHLAPGGRTVLVHEAKYVGGMQSAETTDRLALIDTTTGKVLRTWRNGVTAHRLVETITPAGAAVLFSGDFVPLGMEFSTQPICSLRGDQSFSFFYADF